MRISRGELDRYRAQIASRQDDARAYVIARLRSEARGLTVAEAREASIGIMQDCLSVYGDKAQALSADMFDEICEAEGVDADPGEMFDDVIDSSKLAGKVHYYAGKLVDGDWDGYAGSNADLAAYYVHRSALENMERNCDANRVRYARVGTGRETCGYCFMLSSRGFDYRSEKTASAGSHEHCDCIIVPGVDGVTKIDGYDPAAMRNRWESCCDTIGGRKQLSAEWDSLSKKDKSKHKGKSEAARRDYYIRKRIQAECETRSPGWLCRGEPASVTKEAGAKPNNRELNTASMLSDRGMRLEFRRTRENVDGGKRTSDTFLIVGSGEEEQHMPLEFKQPKGSGKNSIYNQFNEASGQAKRLVIDCTRSPQSYESVCKQAHDGLMRRKDFTDVYVVNHEEITHYSRN